MNKFSVESIQRDLDFCEKVLNQTHDRKDYGMKTRKPEPVLSTLTKQPHPYPKKKKTFRRKTREQLLHEKNSKLEKECTFKPKIIERDIASTQASFVDRLYTTKKYRDYERIKKEKEDEVIQSHCTFTPNTNPSHHSRNNISSSVPPDFFDYLHHSHDERRQYIEQLRMQKDTREMAECSFRPHIGLTSQTMFNSKKTRGRNAPIHKRIGDLQREKENYIKQLQLEQERRQDLKFKPKLNNKSRKILKERESSLIKMRNYEKSERERKILEEHFGSKYTFEPQVNRKSKKILEEKSKYQNMDFYSRQNVYKVEREKQKEIRKKNNKSVFLQEEELFFEERKKRMNVRKRLNKEEADSVVKRLALEDQQERNLKLKLLEQKYGMKECYFNPRTNKQFNKNVKRTEFHELVYNEKAKKKVEHARKKKYTAMKKELPFKPNLISSQKEQQISSLGKENLEPEFNKYRIIDSDSKGVSLDRIKRLRKEKELEIEMRRRKEEKRKLKECTFRPNVVKSAVTYYKHGGLDQSQKPMYINGYHQHLAKCDHAKQIKEERDKREFEVFHKWGKGKTKNWKKISNRKNKKNKNDFITVPKPFKLHENNNYGTYEVKQLARMGDQKYETSNCKYLFK